MRAGHCTEAVDVLLCQKAQILQDLMLPAAPPAAYQPSRAGEL
jgi:hypothetical protein